MAGGRGLLKQRIVRARSEPALKGHVQRDISTASHYWRVSASVRDVKPTGPFASESHRLVKIARVGVIGAVVSCGRGFNSIVPRVSNCKLRQMSLAEQKSQRRP